ncbi:MAG: hypothetical protein JWM53_6560 [bacterium]|nr:hypothetical protein [bacterium]
MLLRNPERAWHHPAPTIDRAEVERRIGPTAEPLQTLSGGLANLNVRVGTDRVLRMRRGEAERLAAEPALLTRPWRSFRTPAVLATGSDFMLLEYVEHGPLPDTAEHGAAVGRALAEIHSLSYPMTGFLAADLSLARAFPNDGSGFTPRGYGRAQLSEAAALLGPELSARILVFLDEDEHAARQAVDVPVLSHCDFKVSNVHWTPGGELLVLDWEFAWAGSRYIDIGQILRWHPPEPFVDAFADAYLAGGGVLVDDWRRFAETVDLCALVGLYRHPAARSTDDVVRRIAETIER